MGSLNHWAASPDLGSAGIAELRKQSQDQSVYSPGLPTNGGSGWHLAAHGGTSTKVSSCRSAAVSADLRGAPDWCVGVVPGAGALAAVMGAHGEHTCSVGAARRIGVRSCAGGCGPA